MYIYIYNTPKCHFQGLTVAGYKNCKSVSSVSNWECWKLRGKKLLPMEKCDFNDFLSISYGSLGTVRDRIWFTKVLFMCLNPQSALSFPATPWLIIYAFSDFWKKWSRGPANNLLLKSGFSLRTGSPDGPFCRGSVEKITHSHIIKDWFIMFMYK